MFSLISNTLHSKNTKKLKQHTYFFSFRLLRIVTSGFVTDFFVIFTPTATLRLPLLLTDSPLLLIYFLRCRTKFIFLLSAFANSASLTHVSTNASGTKEKGVKRVPTSTLTINVSSFFRLLTRVVLNYVCTH